MRPFCLLLLLPLLGCRVDPNQAVVGNWSVDPQGMEIPSLPIPGAEEKIKGVLGTLAIKVRADGTATLSSVAAIDGRWRLDEGELVFTPDKPDLMKRLPLGEGEIRFALSSNLKSMTVRPKTPLGEASVRFLKTG